MTATDASSRERIVSLSSYLVFLHLLILTYIHILTVAISISLHSIFTYPLHTFDVHVICVLYFASFMLKDSLSFKTIICKTIGNTRYNNTAIFCSMSSLAAFCT